MAFETLPARPAPDFGYTEDHAPRVLAAQFGDGYSQRIGDGINSDQGQWSVTWTNIKTADKNTLTDFFKARGGYEAFYWTPPDRAVAVTVICGKWQATPLAAGYWKLSASFQETAELV